MNSAVYLRAEDFEKYSICPTLLDVLQSLNKKGSSQNGVEGQTSVSMLTASHITSHITAAPQQECSDAVVINSQISHDNPEEAADLELPLLMTGPDSVVTSEISDIPQNDPKPPQNDPKPQAPAHPTVPSTPVVQHKHLVHFPRQSHLTAAEQAALLRLLVHNEALPSHMNHKELQYKLSLEQSDFQNFAHLRALNFKRTVYLRTVQELETFIREILSIRLRCVRMYPQYFGQHDTISIVTPRHPQKTVFFHIKSLLNLGTIPSAVIPDLTHFKAPHLHKSKEMEDKVKKRWPHRPKVCSADAVCEKLASTHHVNIVLSSSAFSCLVEATHSVGQWEIPVVIRIFKQADNKEQKVVFIDKPFLPRQMNGVRKQHWATKFTVMHKIQHGGCYAKFKEGNFKDVPHQPYFFESKSATKANNHLARPALSKIKKRYRDKKHMSTAEELLQYEDLETFGNVCTPRPSTTVESVSDETDSSDSESLVQMDGPVDTRQRARCRTLDTPAAKPSLRARTRSMLNHLPDTPTQQRPEHRNTKQLQSKAQKTEEASLNGKKLPGRKAETPQAGETSCFDLNMPQTEVTRVLRSTGSKQLKNAVGSPPDVPRRSLRRRSNLADSSTHGTGETASTGQEKAGSEQAVEMTMEGEAGDDSTKDEHTVNSDTMKDDEEDKDEEVTCESTTEENAVQSDGSNESIISPTGANKKRRIWVDDDQPPLSAHEQWVSRMKQSPALPLSAVKVDKKPAIRIKTSSAKVIDCSAVPCRPKTRAVHRLYSKKLTSYDEVTIPPPITIDTESLAYTPESPPRITDGPVQSIRVIPLNAEDPQQVRHQHPVTGQQYSVTGQDLGTVHTGPVSSVGYDGDSDASDSLYIDEGSPIKQPSNQSTTYVSDACVAGTSVPSNGAGIPNNSSSSYSAIEPSYSAREPTYSAAVPSYSPVPTYSATVSSYSPVPTYSATVPSYSPVPTYSATVPSYSPVPTYSAPVPTYSAAVPSYSPVLTYSAPVPTYSTAVPSYSPVPTYGAAVPNYSPVPTLSASQPSRNASEVSCTPAVPSGNACAPSYSASLTSNSTSVPNTFNACVPSNGSAHSFSTAALRTTDLRQSATSNMTCSNAGSLAPVHTFTSSNAATPNMDAHYAHKSSPISASKRTPEHQGGTETPMDIFKQLGIPISTSAQSSAAPPGHHQTNRTLAPLGLTYCPSRSNLTMTCTPPYVPADYTPDPKEWVPYEDAGKFTPPYCGNLTYNLWQLGAHRVLVRCRVHAVNMKAEEPYLCHIVPKLECQPELGYEQLSTSEIAKAWIQTAIRGPKCKCVRVRVNSKTRAVMKIEELEMAQIVNQGSAFQPQAAVSLLSVIFNKLTSLQVGTYLVGHSPPNSFIHIKKATSSKIGAFDLYQAYEHVGEDPTVDWRPLDPCMPTAEQLAHQIMPCTFHPTFNKKSLTKTKKTKKAFEYKYNEKSPGKTKKLKHKHRQQKPTS